MAHSIGNDSMISPILADDDDSEVILGARRQGECEVTNPLPFPNPLSLPTIQPSARTFRRPTFVHRTPSDMEEGRTSPTQLPLEQELSSQLQRLSAFERRIQDTRSRIREEIQGVERDLHEHTNLMQSQSHPLTTQANASPPSNQTVVIIRDDHKLTTFDGRGNFAAWKREAMQYIHDLNGDGGVSDVNRLLKFISGQARRELLSSPSALDNVDNLFQTLELAYSDQRSLTQVQMAFFSRNQRESEDIMSFATDLKFLFQQLAMRLPAMLANRDEMLVDRFLQGLQSRQVAAQLTLWIRQQGGISFELVRGEAIHLLSVLRTDNQETRRSSFFSRNQAQSNFSSTSQDHRPRYESSRQTNSRYGQVRNPTYRPRYDFHPRQNGAWGNGQTRHNSSQRYAPDFRDFNRPRGNVTQQVPVNRPPAGMREIDVEADRNQRAARFDCSYDGEQSYSGSGDPSCSKNVMGPPRYQ